MALSRRGFVMGGLAWASAATPAVAPPAPYGALPGERQLRWSAMEFYTFLHFTVNTFTDREWGYGDEDPAVFNPTAFDADAIVEALKSAGSAGVILTAKHHDGFCLWPTKTTGHSIRRSPYKGGGGDIVKEVADAARRQGLEFGVYLSPWDRHQASYGTPRYIEIYRRQMRELLTGYGPIFEIWHDGANGGGGYYGGAREERLIDRRSYYGWPETWRLERELQPEAVLFSDVGPDVRWVGNEKGIAGETCWATYSPRGRDGGPAAPGDVREQESITGTRNGGAWMPAECDVSIRPGWFWHEKENAHVKTPRELMTLYLDSVGRGASFLLNVPPDRRGLIHESDAASLRQFGALLGSTFGSNIAAGGRVTASNIRGNSDAYSGRNLLDGDGRTYWATDDGVTTPEVVVDLGRPARFNIVRVREAIGLGQRVEEFAVDAWIDGQWSLFGEGTSIGMCRMLRREQGITSPRARLRIKKSPVCPALSEFGIFEEA